jgi:hypothetical protein
MSNDNEECRPPQQYDEDDDDDDLIRPLLLLPQRMSGPSFITAADEA